MVLEAKCSKNAEYPACLFFYLRNTCPWLEEREYLIQDWAYLNYAEDY